MIYKDSAGILSLSIEGKLPPINFEIYFLHYIKGRLTISFHTTTLLQKRAIPIFYDAFDLKQPVHLQLTIDRFSLDENYLLCGVGGYGDNSEAVLSPSPFSPRKKPEEICGATLAFSVDA